MELLLGDAPRCSIELFARAAEALGGGTSATRSAVSEAAGAAGSLRQRVPEIDAVYMVHYTGAAVSDAKKRSQAMATAERRRVAMGAVFGKHGVHIDRWVTPMDREVLATEDIRCLHQRWEPSEYRLPRKARRHDTQRHEMLKPTQVSVNAKHHLAMYDAVLRGHGLSLIVEDDVLFHACFADHLRNLLDSLRYPPPQNASAVGASAAAAATGDAADPSPPVCHHHDHGSDARVPPPPSHGFDVLWIGGCMNMHAYRRKRKMLGAQLNPHAYLKAEARCAHAYLVTNRAAVALLQSMPLTLPIDFQITTAMRERGLRSVWAEPWLSVQGDFGECVTNELGAGCVSKEKYTRQFDEAFAQTPAECAKFHTVPAQGSVK
jgi:hypothetical protein